MVSEGELVVLIRSGLWDKVAIKDTKKLLIQGQFFHKLNPPKEGLDMLDVQLYFLLISEIIIAFIIS